MCNTFQKSKVVSPWCQTTHLIWLKTYQFNFSNQTTATIKPDQTGSDVELICHHQQTERPGSHIFEIRLRIGQAAEVPPLSSDVVDTWKLLTIWFYSLGLRSNAIAGFFNNVESRIEESEVFFFLDILGIVTKNVLLEHSQLTGTKTNLPSP